MLTQILWWEIFDGIKEPVHWGIQFGIPSKR